jgi:hypothetical protein
MGVEELQLLIFSCLGHKLTSFIVSLFQLQAYSLLILLMAVFSILANELRNLEATRLLAIAI